MNMILDQGAMDAFTPENAAELLTAHLANKPVYARWYYQKGFLYGGKPRLKTLWALLDGESHTATRSDCGATFRYPNFADVRVLVEDCSTGTQYETDLVIFVSNDGGGGYAVEEVVGLGDEYHWAQPEPNRKKTVFKRVISVQFKPSNHRSA